MKPVPDGDIDADPGAAVAAGRAGHHRRRDDRPRRPARRRAALRRPLHFTGSDRPLPIVRTILPGGPLPFDEFIELALYGDAASTRGRAGRVAVATSSPRPRSGRCSARWWPRPRHLVGASSAGPDRSSSSRPGPGRHARPGRPAPVRRALRVRASHYVAGGDSPAQRVDAPDRRGVASPSSPPGRSPGSSSPTSCSTTCRSGCSRSATADWRESFVAARRRSPGRGLRDRGSTRRAPRAADRTAPESRCSERGGRLGRRARVAPARPHRGRRLRHAETAETRSGHGGEWLRTYRGSRAWRPLPRRAGRAGRHDRGGVDQLVVAAGEPDAVRSQPSSPRWGIDELVEEGRGEWAAKAARPNLAALRARSRVREAEALPPPTASGGFTVLEWAR